MPYSQFNSCQPSWSARRQLFFAAISITGVRAAPSSYSETSKALKRTLEDVPSRLYKRADHTAVIVAMTVIGVMIVSVFVIWLVLRNKAPNREKAMEHELPYRMSQDSDSFSLHVNLGIARDSYRYPNSSNTAVNELEGKVASASVRNIHRLSGSAKSSAGTMSTYTSKLTNKTTDASTPLNPSMNRLSRDTSQSIAIDSHLNTSPPIGGLREEEISGPTEQQLISIPPPLSAQIETSLTKSPDTLKERPTE